MTIIDKEEAAVAASLLFKLNISPINFFWRIIIIIINKFNFLMKKKNFYN